MSIFSDKVSYIRGLADGLQLSSEEPANRLLLAIIDAMDSLNDELKRMDADQKELNEYVESLDDDMCDIEDELYGSEFDDDDDDDDECDHCNCDDDDEDDDEDDGDYGIVALGKCPYCGEELPLTRDDLESESPLLCPECGKELKVDPNDADE